MASTSVSIPYPLQSMMVQTRLRSMDISDDIQHYPIYEPLFGTEKLFHNFARPPMPVLPPSDHHLYGNRNDYSIPPPSNYTNKEYLHFNNSMRSFSPSSTGYSGSQSGSSSHSDRALSPTIDAFHRNMDFGGLSLMDKDDSHKRRVNPGIPSDPHEIFSKDSEEVFARKVFVGGLPIDVSEDEIRQTFSCFGKVLVDWPRRPDGSTSRDEESCIKNGRSMTGYVFLVFEKEASVQMLVNECHREGDRYYLFVSSPTMRDKPVQVRPWRLSDMDYMLDGQMLMDPRRTVFIGGVPRPTKAKELAECLNQLYGRVCYVGIDIDPELKYPKGAARVTFSSTESFIAAIMGRFVHVQHTESQKRVEIKPYVMDGQQCDECEGRNCSSQYAPYFCGDVGCLQYYCETCWDKVHYSCESKRTTHRPLVRQGDQTKILPRPPHHHHSRGNGGMSRHHRMYMPSSSLL